MTNMRIVASLLIHTAPNKSVHPTGGSLRVFRQFSGLKAGSVKAALSRPTHQRVTQAVSWIYSFVIRGIYKLHVANST